MIPQEKNDAAGKTGDQVSAIQSTAVRDLTTAGHQSGRKTQ
jgi:hypothetical protein